MLAFSTAKINGHYDFFNGLITLDCYDVSHLELIKLAISEVPPPNTSEEANKLRDIRALIKHELTHFLDHVTTEWGVETIARRGLLIESINNEYDDIENRGDVYFVNMSELQMHSELVNIHENIPFLECDTVKHNLVYEEKHGSYINVKFFKKDRLSCDVPLSMLSLLEANAISNEFLSRFDDITHMNQEFRRIAESAVERKLEKLLNEPSLSEYSVLILLAKIHFKFLDSRQLLVFMSHLASFCLNISDISRGAIPEVIYRSFSNKVIGNCIWAELSRGMSRHVIAFKTILFMYQWLNELEENIRIKQINMIKINPFEVIKNFWNDNGRYKEVTDDFDREMMIRCLDSRRPEDVSLIKQALDKNKFWLEKRNLGYSSFDEISSLDILLSDDSIIQFNNRIDLDVVDHTYKTLDAYLESEKLLENISKKNHMTIEEAKEMREKITSMVTI